MNPKKWKSKKELNYEDNLGDNKLDSGLIVDRLLDVFGEDVVSELNNLLAVDESGQNVSDHLLNKWAK